MRPPHWDCGRFPNKGVNSSLLYYRDVALVHFTIATLNTEEELLNRRHLGCAAMKQYFGLGYISLLYLPHFQLIQHRQQKRRGQNVRKPVHVEMGVQILFHSNIINKYEELPIFFLDL